MSSEPTKPAMQFGLSGLLLMAPAVGLGCLGWKLGEWMDASKFQSDLTLAIAGVLLTPTACVLWTAIVLGGWRAGLFAVVGFIANAFALFGTIGLPPPHLFDVVLAIALFSMCLPWASLAATATNAWREPNGRNAALAIFSCLPAGWILFLVCMSTHW